MVSVIAPGPALLGIAAGLMAWDGSGRLWQCLRSGGGWRWIGGGALAGASALCLLHRMQLRDLQHAKHDRNAELGAQPK